MKSIKSKQSLFEAAFFACIVVIFLIFFNFVSINNSLSENVRVLPSHIKEFKINSNRYNLIIFGFILIFYILYNITNFGRNILLKFVNAKLVIIISCFSFLFLAYSARNFSTLLTLALLLIIIKFDLVKWLRINYNVLRTPFFLLFLLIFYFFYIYPFGANLSVGTESAIENIESHYSMVVYPGYKIIINSIGFSNAKFNYGIGVGLLTSIIIWLRSTFDVALNNLVLAVYIYQIIGMLLFIFIVFMCSPNRKILNICIVTILALNLSSVSSAVYLPNQSGVRFIPLLLGIIILILNKSNRSSIYFLAISGSIFTYVTPEFGLILTFAYLVHSCLSKENLINFVKLFYVFIKFWTIYLVSFIVISSFIFLFTTLHPLAIFEYLFSFISGYGGLATMPSPQFFLYFLIALYFFKDAIQNLKLDDPNSSTRLQASIATIILLWLAYYVNRMHEWNLWIICPLIFVNLLVYCTGNPKFLYKRNSFVIYASIYTLIFSLLSLIPKYVAEYNRFLSVKECNAGRLIDSVFCVDNSVGYLADYYNEMSLLPANSKRIFISKFFPLHSNVYTSYKDIKFNDPFGEVKSYNERIEYINEIKNLTDAVIYTDVNCTLVPELDNRADHICEILAKLPLIKDQRSYGIWQSYRFSD